MRSKVSKGERFRLEVTFSWTLLTNRGYLVPLTVPRGDPLQRAGPGNQRHGLSSLGSPACKRVRTLIYALLSIGDGYYMRANNLQLYILSSLVSFMHN